MSFPIPTEPLWSQGGKNVEKEKCKTEDKGCFTVSLETQINNLQNLLRYQPTTSECSKINGTPHELWARRGRYTSVIPALEADARLQAPE